MSGGEHKFQSWEEHMICEERGKRVVHFYLKDAAGASVLVVAGHESSIRHFKCCVAEEFSATYGLGRCSNAKPLIWRSRREVVEWLEKFVSHPAQPQVQLDSKLISAQKQLIESSGSNHLKTEQLTSVSAINKRLTVTEQQLSLPFRIGQRIEVLSQDSGIRGSWHRCVILEVDENKHLKVEYEDLVDAEDENIRYAYEPPEIQNGVMSSLNSKRFSRSGIRSGPRRARTDELQMRCMGRLTIRPTSSSFPTHHDWVIGSSVDVWLWDAWWEGVVTKVNYPRKNSLQVYFPGERFEVTVETKDVRASRDWANGRWIDISPKADILSHISSAKLSKK